MCSAPCTGQCSGPCSAQCRRDWGASELIMGGHPTPARYKGVEGPFTEEGILGREGVFGCWGWAFQKLHFAISLFHHQVPPCLPHKDHFSSRLCSDGWRR